MIRWLSNVLRRPAYRAGEMLHSPSRRTRTANPQFVSFLRESGFRRVDADQYERSLQRRRVALQIFTWAGIAGFAWVVIESAHALSMF